MNRIELTLHELLLAVKNKWRFLIICALLASLLMGVFNFATNSSAFSLSAVDSNRQLKAHRASVEAQRKDIAAKEKEMNAKYEEFKKIEEETLNRANSFITREREIKGMEDSLVLLQKAQEINTGYIDSSILMQIDPQNAQVATISFSLGMAGGHETAALDTAAINRLVNHYLLIANNMLLTEVLAGVLPEKYSEISLREIVSVSTFSQSLNKPSKDTASIPLPAAQGAGNFIIEDITNAGGLYRAQENDNIVIIKVYGTDKVAANIIAQTIFNYFKAQQPLIADAVGQHRLTIIEENSSFTTDPALLQLQKDYQARVTEGDRAISKVNQDIVRLNADVEVMQTRQGVALESLEKARADLSRLTKELNDLTGNLESFIAKGPEVEKSTGRISHLLKGMVMGLMVGLIFSIITVIITYLIKLPIVSKLQVQRQLGLRFLGSVDSRKISRPNGSAETAGHNVAEGKAMNGLDLIAANIAEAGDGARKVLLTGSLPGETIERAAQLLASKTQVMELVHAGSVNSSAQAVKLLNESDAVVLVERLGVSGLREVLAEKERLDYSGKKLLGYVLV